MEDEKIIVGLVQMRMDESPESNLAKALSMVAKAAESGAAIVCLPELFTTRYFPQKAGGRAAALGLAEEIPGKTASALSGAARKHGISIIGGSIYEKSGSSLYNASAVFGPDGKMLGKYRKIHVPHDECFFEKDYFGEGDLGFRVFDLGAARAGVLICYDQWFPEAARAEALMGADVLFYPTAIGTADGVEQSEGDWHSAWENVMRGHAIANGVAVAAANRCGREGGMDFWGGSFVCDAFGKTIAKAGADEEVLIARIGPGHGKAVREGWGFLRNRRPGQYGKLVEGK